MDHALKTQKTNPWSTRGGWDWVLSRTEKDSNRSWVSGDNLDRDTRQRVEESLRTKKS